MFTTSTHKSEWLFDSVERLAALRKEVGEKFKSQYDEVLQPGESPFFLEPIDESTMLSIVQEAALKFGDDFKPHLFPSVRYMAFAYFKRFFLKKTVMEYSPKMVMMACYYIATKIDEFYVPIQEFVANLRSGTAETNTHLILTLEPEILRVLNYSLVVHAPYRTVEGIFVEMKQRMSLLNFDIESLRPNCTEFISRSLLTDAMLLYSPTHIALAAFKYALDAQARAVELTREFLQRISGVDETHHGKEYESHLINSIDAQLDSIVKMVETDSATVLSDRREVCMKKCTQVSQLLPVLEQRRRQLPTAGRKNGNKSDSEDD